MPSFAEKKNRFAREASVLASDIMELTERCEAFASFYFANGFDGAGANPIADEDLTNNNAHLTATDVSNVVTLSQAIGTAVTSGHRDNMRKAMIKPRT